MKNFYYKILLIMFWFLNMNYYSKSFLMKDLIFIQKLTQNECNGPYFLYYKMKIGDVVRIERPSESSGIVSSYRIVTNAINK